MADLTCLSARPQMLNPKARTPHWRTPVMPDTSEMIAAIRAGCAASYAGRLDCIFPACGCRSNPDAFRAAIAAYEAERPPADNTLRKIAEEMDQWLRVCFKDSHGNTVYVNCNYYGDGYEYDDLDAGGKPARSPGPPREDD